MGWYRAGTISVTQGSDTVIGTGTNWISQHQGWVLVSQASGALHEIKSIVSSTEITLSKPLEDATTTALEYFIIPTHSLNADLIEKLNEMIAQFTTSREAWAAVYDDFSAGPYQLWLDQGNSGTVAEFLTFLKGDKGDKGDMGLSTYMVWIAEGNTGTVAEFLDAQSQQAITATASNVTDAQAAQVAAEAARDTTALSATAAADALGQTEALFDQMDDSWLGDKAADPTTDNDGDPLQVGARYWNTTADEWRVWDGTNWEAPSQLVATSAAQAAAARDAAQAAEAAAEAADTAAQAAQAVSEAARDEAQSHAAAASLASNATKWVSGSDLGEGELVWSPSNGQTYRAILAITNSVVDPATVDDPAIFVAASGGTGGGGGGANFMQSYINAGGELILSFYDPGETASAADFYINDDGQLVVNV